MTNHKTTSARRRHARDNDNARARLLRKRSRSRVSMSSVTTWRQRLKCKRIYRTRVSKRRRRRRRRRRWRDGKKLAHRRTHGELFALQVTTYWLRDRIPENRPCLIAIVTLCVLHMYTIDRNAAASESRASIRQCSGANRCEPDLIYRKPLDPYIYTSLNRFAKMCVVPTHCYWIGDREGRGVRETRWCRTCAVCMCVQPAC